MSAARRSSGAGIAAPHRRCPQARVKSWWCGTSKSWFPRLLPKLPANGNRMLGRELFPGRGVFHGGGWQVAEGELGDRPNAGIAQQEFDGERQPERALETILDLQHHQRIDPQCGPRLAVLDLVAGTQAENLPHGLVDVVLEKFPTLRFGSGPQGFRKIVR